MKKVSVGIVLALLITAMVIPAALAQDGYPAPGSSVTNVVVQNKATGDPATDTATVVVEYYDQEGNLDHTHADIMIAPKAVTEIKTDQEDVLGDGWVGSAVMSSDQPLAAIVSIKNTNVPGASDGFTQGAYNGASQGANIIYFPSVWRFGGIVSRLTVQNTESDAADVTLYYYDRAGSSLGTVVRNIPGYSQDTFYLGDSNDVPAGFDTFVDGSVYVESDNLLAGAAVASYSNRSNAYQALTPDNKGTVLYAPSHYRYSPTGNWDLFSAINLQNTTGSVANVDAYYFTRGDLSGTPALTMTFQIQPYSATGLNTKNGGDFDASDFDPLTTDWDGSVKVVSDQELVGTCITNWGAGAKSGAYALVTPANSSNVLFVPAQYRLMGTTWNQWSAINLMNVGDSTIAAADLTLQYISQAGVEVASFSGTDLPGDLAPGAAVGLNTRNGGDLDAVDFEAFGTSFIGGIYITAPEGSDLVGVANIIYSNRASVYNAVP
jgi:hypothetical protein